MDIGVGIRCFILLPLLLVSCCAFRCSFAENEKVQSAVVVGTVYCDTCFRQEFSKASRFISGASVAIECGEFRKEVKTNRRGMFRARLPTKISKHIDSVGSCSVKLIRSNHPFCSAASFATSSGLRLKSKRKDLHVFSAGFFAFKPLKQPELCNQEPKPQQTIAEPDLIFPPFFPPLPLVPPPSLLPPVIPSPPPSFPPTPPPPASIFPPFPIPLPPSPLIPGNPPHPEKTSP
ncbi:pollen allergen Che a 1-like [Asparagus officinalis]|uniref:pollen allergen Che a 1-like n=1 Tax=Asparagus officinalis TaxID=4686 RepID=UPI00098DEA53|nr:pollen allergen Che a 1-like [Asparagus officinalis]